MGDKQYTQIQVNNIISVHDKKRDREITRLKDELKKAKEIMVDPVDYQNMKTTLRNENFKLMAERKELKDELRKVKEERDKAQQDYIDELATNKHQEITSLKALNKGAEITIDNLMAENERLKLVELNYKTWEPMAKKEFNYLTTAKRELLEGLEKVLKIECLFFLDDGTTEIKIPHKSGGGITLTQNTVNCMIKEKKIAQELIKKYSK